MAIPDAGGIFWLIWNRDWRNPILMAQAAQCQGRKDEVDFLRWKQFQMLSNGLIMTFPLRTRLPATQIRDSMYPLATGSNSVITKRTKDQLERRPAPGYILVKWRLVEVHIGGKFRVISSRLKCLNRSRMNLWKDLGDGYHDKSMFIKAFSKSI